MLRQASRTAARPASRFRRRRLQREMTFRASRRRTDRRCGSRRNHTLRRQDGYVANLVCGALLIHVTAPSHIWRSSRRCTWPPLKAGESSNAGRFYVVWCGPDGADRAGQWPYQVAYRSVAPLAALSMLAPAIGLSAQDPIRHGLRRRKTLLACPH